MTRSDRRATPRGRASAAAAAFAGLAVAGWLAASNPASAQQADEQPTRTDAAVPARPVGPTTSAPPAAAEPSAATVPTLTRGLDLSPAVLKSAIGAADEDYARIDTRSVFGAVPAAPQRGFDRAFDAADIEGCGKAEGAFKFAPPVIGPVPFGGLLVAPFWLHAMAPGRCKL